MSPRKKSDEWIDEDEYPDDRDIEDFGDESPTDYDPRTMGYIGNQSPSIWTPRRIILLVVGLLIVAALVLPLISALAR